MRSPSADTDGLQYHLRDLFERAVGPVVSVALRPRRGFGLVTLESAANIAKALETPFELGGRALVVSSVGNDPVEFSSSSSSSSFFY